MMVIGILRHMMIQRLHFETNGSDVHATIDTGHSSEKCQVAGRCNSGFWCFILFPTHAKKDFSNQEMYILPRFLFDERTFRALARTAAWPRTEDS